jgi:hypothetical protein
MSGPTRDRMSQRSAFQTLWSRFQSGGPQLTKRRLQSSLPARNTEAVASLRQHCLTVTRVAHAATLTAARTARHWRGTADEQSASEWPGLPPASPPLPFCYNIRYQNFCNITLGSTSNQQVRHWSDWVGSWTDDNPPIKWQVLQILCSTSLPILFHGPLLLLHFVFLRFHYRHNPTYSD